MKHSQKRTFMDIEKMSSDEFKAFCRLGNKNHFTRIRKMPLQDLLFTMIQVIAKHIPKTCVKEINVLSYRYFNAENKKHLILGTTNKPHLAMKLVSPMQ